MALDELACMADDELDAAAASVDDCVWMAVLETLALDELMLVTFFLTTTSRSTSATSRLLDSAAAAKTRCCDRKELRQDSDCSRSSLTDLSFLWRTEVVSTCMVFSLARYIS